MSPIDFILSREAHWQATLETTERARAYALRQLENCQQLKRLVAEEVTLVLLHGGECD